MQSNIDCAIKLFVISNGDLDVICDDLFEQICSDNAQLDHIASQEDYNELRAQYWVWKNEHSVDYVGFFHYRRYLDLSKCNADFSFNKNKCLPYHIIKTPAELSLKPSVVHSFIQSYDVIAPLPEYTGITVMERYGWSKGQCASDLNLVKKIICDKYPKFASAAQKYLNGKSEYYGNIYIMRKEIFDTYCTWLFSILFEFDRCVENKLPRTNGFLGERLFGIYYTWLQDNKKYQCCELPRVHFWCFDDKTHHFKQQKMINFLLPPGSERRTILKRFKVLFEK